MARVALALSGPAMGAWAGYGAEEPELTALYDEVAAGLGADRVDLRARVLSYRAAVRTVHDPRGAQRDAVEALRLATAVGEPAVLKTALFAVHVANRGYNGVERLAITDRLLELVDERDHPTDALDGLQLRLCDLVELGRLAEADDLIERVAELGGDWNLVARWNVQRYTAMRQALAGDLAAAEATGAAAYEIGQKVQPENAVGSYGALLSVLQYLRGQVRGFAGQVAALAERHPSVSTYRSMVPFFAAQEGDLGGAATALREAMAAGVPLDNNYIASNTVLAVAAHDVGDAAAAAELYKALLPCAGMHAAAGSWVASLGPVDRALALVADTMGEPAVAAAHAADAEAWCRQVGARAYLAVVRMEQARRDPANGAAVGEAAALADELGLGLVQAGLAAR